ncbi:type III effector HrpK domain-containing protein [Pseudomonas indica]|uniref:type III effector HrpK domain-containing protein n=1 Tax=Pseudomonas indica TaxID=137658 RepID=UPI0023F677CE|nr:type III effector HrpK domain-containing protein [Pseudomonas indica]MBU3056839.1 hypothetical protein [Pseudomonas indica]
MVLRVSDACHSYGSFDVHSQPELSIRPQAKPPVSSTGIEFGPAPTSSPEPRVPAGGTNSSLFDRLLPPAKPEPSMPSPVVLASEPAQEDGPYDFLDNSPHSSPEQLKKWEALLGDLPPAEREAAAKELNRPIAAARIAAEGGPDAEKAWAFINDNPSLKTAVDVGKDGGRADGKITHKDLKAFANHMDDRLNDAGKTLRKYEKEHPDADPASKQLVRSAALMLANEPLTQAADPASAQGAANQRKVNGCISTAGLTALQENEGLSDVLRNAATTWSQPGMFELLDRGAASGKKLAKKGPDGQANSKDIMKWIEDKAPSSSDAFASTLFDAATVGAVSKTDTSQLNGDIFEHPDSYTGEQKAAVLVKLQQTQEQVIAGRGIRDTRETEEALAGRIEQLQNDPDVQSFLRLNLDEQATSIVNGDPRLAKLVSKGTVDGGPGLHTPNGIGSDKRAGPIDEGKEALKVTADTVHRVVNFGSGTFERQGGKAVVGLGGRIAAAVGGRVVGAVAGEAAGAAAASAIGAAAGPVGWAVSGIMAIGMGIGEIVNAVKERKERKAFSRTVNPTLEQFGIPKPK